MGVSATEKLRRFHGMFSGSDHVLVIINADPDAIASAMAIKRLLWRKTGSVTISNINSIKRPDNIAMIQRLGVLLVGINKIDKSAYTRFVMVDSQPEHNIAFSPFKPDVIIDHHPETNTTAPFVDIRPKYGATASIMTEYLKAAKIKPSAKLATGLFYAIKTDTFNFERRALIEDVRAFQFLYQHANIQLVRKIEQSDLKLIFLKYFQRAIENMRRNKDRTFVHLGHIINPDVCVLIADFFLRIDTINWSIVSGIFGKKLIIVFRNDGLRKNAGILAKQSFGKFGSAGGHKTMARAELLISQIEALVDPNDSKKLLKWIMTNIKKKA